MRPWWLIPKVLSVGVYYGGLVTAAVLWFTGPRRSMDKGDHILQWIDQVGSVFRFVVVPAVSAAMVFGFLLLLQHPRVLIRLRWLRVKLVIVALFIPAAHVFLSSRLALLREAAAQSTIDYSAEWQFEMGLVAAIAISTLIVVLGRHKPKLGQNWAKAFAGKER